MLATVLAFIGLDLITGLIKALKNHNVTSKKLRDGLFKKSGLLIVYFLAWLLIYASNYVDLELPIDLQAGAVIYIIVIETVSITENICLINPDIAPDVLKKLFGMEDKN